MNANQNYPEFGIYGRPLLWWAIEIPRTWLEQMLVAHIKRIIKRGNDEGELNTGKKLFNAYAAIEFKLRQLKDMVPDSQYRI